MRMYGQCQGEHGRLVATLRHTAFSYGGGYVKQLWITTVHLQLFQPPTTSAGAGDGTRPEQTGSWQGVLNGSHWTGLFGGSVPSQEICQFVPIGNFGNQRILRAEGPLYSPDSLYTMFCCSHIAQPSGGLRNQGPVVVFWSLLPHLVMTSHYVAARLN